MTAKSRFLVSASLVLLTGCLILATGAVAQVSSTTLFHFDNPSPDYQGWILQLVERYDNNSGLNTVLPYQPFVPEGWQDDTEYPYIPGNDPLANGTGAFEVGLHLEGVWDNVNDDHDWFDAAFLQSEDYYTHFQSNWPAGWEHHPDYGGGWVYGHYGTIGAVGDPDDYLRLRVYNPGFAHQYDPVEAYLYTKSGPGWTWVDNGGVNVEHGWNVLRFLVSEIHDPTDLLELGVKMGANHHVWGSMFVDGVTLGSVELSGGQRFVYLLPDTAWISEEPDYDSKVVKIYYDDGGGVTPGVRGFHVVVNFDATCVQATAVAQGTILSGEPNNFQYLIDNINGDVTVDWVILGATSGASGDGSVAGITFAATDPDNDCCGPLDLDENNSTLRDPDNNSLAAVYVDGQISHDITPPTNPTLSSSTHTEGVSSSLDDLKIEWATITDAGTCPVGVRGYYFKLDQNATGAPDPTIDDFDWFTPWSPDSSDYAYWYDDLADGTWYVHMIGYDWLWNSSDVDHFGPIIIDTGPPANVTGFDADITDNSDLSADLTWTNPADADFAGVEIHRKGFGFYPEYDDGGGAQPAWPTSPSDAVANGWTQVYNSNGTGTVDNPGVRDYYYYAAFAYDTATPPNYAAATSDSRDESLCYWLGDFAVGGAHVVDIIDVNVLSLCYNTSEAGGGTYNNICDIGPTTDYGRKSRPTTDNLIDFEDLIVLAMNYENESLLAPPVAEPCVGTMRAVVLLNRNGDELEVSVLLKDNPGCLLGTSVELSYGPNLEYVGAAAGDVWSGVPSFFIDAQGESHSIRLDGVGLGGTVTADGCHAIARFRILDATARDLQISVAGFQARGPGNIDLSGGYQVQDTEPAGTLPGTHALFGATPNPASQGALIRYALATEQRVQIGLFDATGRLVRMLFDGVCPVGHYDVTWDGLSGDGSAAGPGIYFYRMQAGDYTCTRKLTVVN